MGQPSDHQASEWVDAASRGDAESIDQLLQEFLPDLQAYVRRHAGRLALARESSADIVQSICRELLEHLGDGRFQYQGVGPFRKWLYRAALLKISARRRHNGAEARHPDLEREGLIQNDSSSPALEPFTVDGSPSRVAVLHEELDRLRVGLEELPVRYAEVISMAQVDGLAHAEIARRLEITESHSRVLLARALARLASNLRRHESGAEAE